MLACWQRSWELQLCVQPWTEGGENCASSSVTSCLLTDVVYIRMKRIRRGWVLPLTREGVPGWICSTKERCLKWDRGWQANRKTPCKMHRHIEICLEIMDRGRITCTSSGSRIEDGWISCVVPSVTVWASSTAQGTEWRQTWVACFLAAVLWQ